MSDKIEERLRRREIRYDRERRMRVKWSENIRVLEEVFDQRTIMTVLKILNIGKLREITGVLKAGKESRVFHGIGEDGSEVAVKIFLTTSAVFRSGRLKYLSGDPRFKTIFRDSSSVVDQWAQKEFWNLRLASDAGVAAPRPIYVEKNVLIISFIGKDGVSAPLLREIQLQAPSLWYKKMLEMLKLLWDKVGLVHGDVSEYNIMIPNGYPVLIDFGQAVTKDHPEAKRFLQRDVQNLNHYFGALGIRTKPYEKIFGEE